MREKICEYLKERESCEDSVVFIETTPLALTFNPRNFPAALENVLPTTAYAKVVSEVNKIIESEYMRFKSSSYVKREESFIGKLFLSLLVLLFLAFMITRNSCNCYHI